MYTLIEHMYTLVEFIQILWGADKQQAMAAKTNAKNLALGHKQSKYMPIVSRDICQAMPW